VRTAPLTVVAATPATSPQPPDTLGDHGRALWNRIVTSYNFEDEAGQELLSQLCHAADRCESLRAQIDRDGELITGRDLLPLNALGFG
jgi:hypothetical protein